MPSKLNVLAGTKYGLLTVIKESCECGNCLNVRLEDLRKGNTKSCGCYKTKSTKKRLTTHGKKGYPEHNSWSGMLQRCYNKKAPGYIYYGFRGITVCEEWKSSFEFFYKDMGERPEGTSIDRIDNDGIGVLKLFHSVRARAVLQQS